MAMKTWDTEICRKKTLQLGKKDLEYKTVSCDEMSRWKFFYSKKKREEKN